MVFLCPYMNSQDAKQELLIRKTAESYSVEFNNWEDVDDEQQHGVIHSVYILSSHYYRMVASNNSVFTQRIYLYSSQALMSISSKLSVQKAEIKALANRLLVIKGTFKSIAARRIL